MAIKFIPDIRDAWRFLSVQLGAVAAVLAGAYDYWPSIQQILPDSWEMYAFAAIVAARLIEVGGKPAAPVEPVEGEVQ